MWVLGALQHQRRGTVTTPKTLLATLLNTFLVTLPFAALSLSLSCSTNLCSTSWLNLLFLQDLPTLPCSTWPIIPLLQLFLAVLTFAVLPHRHLSSCRAYQHSLAVPNPYQSSFSSFLQHFFVEPSLLAGLHTHSLQ